MTWICDSCGKTIATVEEGWVEWHHVVGGDERGLRLVHKAGCQYDRDALFKDGKRLVSDLALEDFLGPDGLMLLLSFFVVKPAMPREEVIEMIKRLHVAGYELTRLHLAEARADDVYEPNTHEAFPWQSDIEAVKNWLAARDDE